MIRRKIYYLLVLFFFILNTGKGQTSVSGNISGDITWSVSESPINIVGDVGVPNGSVLRIQNGVSVNFTGNFQILILGSIMISGVENDSVVFNGYTTGGPGTKKMLEFQNTDLSLSNISYGKFLGGQDVLLVSREAEGAEDFPKNYGTLNFDHCRFKNSIIQTDGYNSQGELVISNSKFESMLIKGRYPRSEPIRIINGKIMNSTIYADSYNKGISLTGTDIKNSEFRIGCCENVNITIDSSRLEDCDFFAENDHHKINISNSILVNVQISRKASSWFTNQELNIDNSIVYNNSTHSLRYQNMKVSNSFIAGNGLGTALDASYVGNNSITFSNSTITGFWKSAVINGFGTFTNSNFLEASTYIELMTDDNTNAINNYWDLGGLPLEDKITDSQDDLSLGTVTTTPLSNKFVPYAPAFPNGDLGLLATNKQLFVSRVKSLPGCSNELLEVVVKADNGFDNNLFILQMSDKHHSFNNAVNLAELEGTDVVLSSYIPDTIAFGMPYLLRVYSTQLDLFTTPVEIIVQKTPMAEFSTQDLTLCYGEPTIIEYTGNITPQTSYNWSFDGGAIISGDGPGPYSIKWDTPGQKTISLTVTENGCASAVAEQVVEVNPQLINTFEAPAILCQGDTAIINFTGSVPVGATYSWSLDGGTLTSLNDSTQLNVIWDQLGTKSVSLQITYNNCVTDLLVKDISYNQLPTADFNTTARLCYGEPALVEYTGNASDLATFNWNFNGGTIVSGEGKGPYSIKWDSPGQKTVSLTVTENGCTSAITEQIIEVNPQLINTFEAPAILCQGDTAIINFTGSVPVGATYSWSLDGGTQTSLNDSTQLNVIWDQLGTKSVSLQITYNNCVTDLLVKDISYNQLPTADFNTTARLCYGEPAIVEYTGNASDLASYDWTFDAATIVNGAGPGPYSIKWDSPGEKNLSLTVSEAGCSSSIKNSTVLISPLPVAPSICIVTVDDELSKNKIAWKNDDNHITKFGIYRETNVADAYALIEYIDANVFNTFVDIQSSPDQVSNRYKITALDSCGMESEMSNYHKTLHLTINKGLDNSWNLIWDGYEGFAFGTYKIYRSINGSGFELLTELASNLTSFTDQNVQATRVAYQIEVVNPYPCEEVTDVGTNLYSASFSNVARVETITGLSALNASLNVFPNPTSGILQIELEGSRLQAYQIFNLAGQMIKSGNSMSMENSIVDIADVPSGTYLLKAIFDRSTHLQRIIKQ